MLLAGHVRDGMQVEISANRDGLTFNGKKPSRGDGGIRIGIRAVERRKLR